MRVVHLWRSPQADGGGGGGVSLRRLHDALLREGVASRILCDQPEGHDDTVHAIPRWRVVDGALQRLTSRTGLNDIHRASSFRVRRHPLVASADIVHVHGTHSGFFNYLALPGLTRCKPVVFTVHDMWPLTGHCAVNFDCDRWRIGCGECPYLDAHPAVRRDATRLEWRLKRHVYRRSAMTVVTVSSEYSRRAREGLLSSFPHHTILGAVDTELFRPRAVTAVREQLGITADELVIMAAANDLSLPQKGMTSLLEAVAMLPDRLSQRTRLLLVGRDPGHLHSSSTLRSASVGFVSDRQQLAELYSCADVVAMPSRIETFGLVAAEALACGTPVVAYGVGGLPDIVRPGENGFLAAPGDPTDLASKLTRILDDDSRQELRIRCRRDAVTRLTAEREAHEYLRVYEEALARTP